MKTVQKDWRNVEHGWHIPGEPGYADQPYLVKTHEGHWLCVMTTNKNSEGQESQHVVSTISTDQGRTWSPLVDIEPADAPNSSWAISWVAPSGRIYVFYLYNGDEVPLQEHIGRWDVMGWFAFRVSDDHGRSWSKERYRIPIRETAVDRENVLNGEHQMFWGVDQPFEAHGGLYIPFTKMRKQLRDEEGFCLRCEEILKHDNIDDFNWQLLPDGDHGLFHPDYGIVQEEHIMSPLDVENGLYCIWRTKMGHPLESYSYDAGHNWTTPRPVRFSQGRVMKHPTACPRVWKIGKGKHLLWFHYNGGDSVYSERRIVWASGGVERDREILWSEPEIIMYRLEEGRGMSYPDLIIDEGEYYISETQKDVARIHQVDSETINDMFAQGSDRRQVEEGLIVRMSERDIKKGVYTMPELPSLAAGGGLTIDMWVKPATGTPDQIVFDTMNENGAGIRIVTDKDDTLRIHLSDGKTSTSWATDPGLLSHDYSHNVTFIVDGAAKVISIVIDGRLCDGGEHEEFGWGRVPHELDVVSGGPELRVLQGDGKHEAFDGKLMQVRIYNRFLRTSEALRTYQGMPYSDGNEITPLGG